MLLYIAGWASFFPFPMAYEGEGKEMSLIYQMSIFIIHSRVPCGLIEIGLRPTKANEENRENDLCNEDCYCIQLLKFTGWF
jgi:hypothetical protein